MNKKIIWFLMVTAIVGLLVTGYLKNLVPVSVPQDMSKLEQRSQLKVGLLKMTSSAPIFIGIEKGFFKEEGINLDLQWFEAAQPIAVATASNQVDVGATGITASLYNMLAEGQNLEIVADKGREKEGYSSSALFVRTDLWEQGCKSVADLKGKKIGITQKGSTWNYMIGRILEKNGLTMDDVEIVPLAKLAAMTASLQSKQVDAIIISEPYLSEVRKAGYGKLLVNVGDVMDYQISAIFFSSNFTKDTSTARRFLKGYVKSCRYYYDAVLNKQNDMIVPGANYEEVINIVAKYTGAPTEVIKSGFPYIDRDGKLLSKDIQTQIDWYYNHKMIEKMVDASQIVNSSLLDEVLRQI